MELKDFIKQTIIEITQGVIEGHRQITKDYGGEGVHDEYHRVNFDVAVTSDEQEKKDLEGKYLSLQSFLEEPLQRLFKRIQTKIESNSIFKYI